MTRIDSDILLNRFISYVKTYSESNSEKADSGIMPSTPQQWKMAELVCNELKSLGLENVHTDENCYTYGLLKSSDGYEDIPSFCLIAHIDTVDEVTGKDVKPIVHKNYDGKPIDLPYGITLDPESDKYLALAGQQKETIITSDGSTLLGADDKAGVAEIMTAIEYLVHNPEVKHGTIEVLFSPDEETGHGMDKINLSMIHSKMCYTVDGGHIGELETECFNAYKSEIIFTGKSKHTGDARPDMVNAVCMAASFIANLPRQEMPETTDGYMGFYAPLEMKGSIEQSSVLVLLRDFTEIGIKKRMHIVDLVAQMTAETFNGTVQVKHTQQYLNMKEKLDEHPLIVDKLVQAYKDTGIEPVFKPIRGGTDGSRLTEMGIPTPNIFTGGHNYHSRYEWASLTQMTNAAEILIQLSQSWL
ncbi:MAG: peptidase T [Treponema sp.]|nr:peptidase T [Treponema sp.]